MRRKVAKRLRQQAREMTTPQKPRVIRAPCGDYHAEGTLDRVYHDLKKAYKEKVSK